MSIYLNIKNSLLFIMLIVLSAFIYNTQVYADVIGCDADGIVCLNDDLELYSNDFRTLDLDFDGKYELYYFDVNGRLKTNDYTNNYYLNEKGQQSINGNVTVIDIEPKDIKIYQIDNLDYYYIDRVKSKFNENWEIQGVKEEKLQARVNIDIPEIAGENKTIVDKINNQLKIRGLELLKLYAKEEVYRRNTRKFSIIISKFVKSDVQKLCFVPMLDNKFYFNFDVYITLDNKDEIHKNIGLCVDTDTCYITNNELHIYESFKKLAGKHNDNLREKIKKSKIKKKENYFENLINETKEIMANNGTIGSFNKVILSSIVCCVVGIVISLLLDNIFILPVITIMLGLIPFYFVKVQTMIYREEVKKELETALSNITSSYMRLNTSFLEAVKENVDNIKNPLKATFQKYIITCEHINSNNRENLEQLKKAVNDDTYREWVDGVIASEEDYNLKATLPNITNKFSDMRIINNELSTKMFEPLRDYIYIVILVIISVPLFYLFNRDAVIDYINLPLGKIEMTIIFVVIIIVSFKVAKELRPAEYRRLTINCQEKK